MPEGDFQRGGSLVAQPFRPVDTDELSSSLAIATKGACDGRNNEPAPDAGTFSATENEIVLLFGAERERCAADAAAHLRAQNDALAQLETAMDIAALRNDAGDAVSTLEKIDREWQGEIPRLLRAAREARAEFDAFRQRHRISRPARQPGHRGLALAWLAFFVTIESALNGMFFAEGAEAGLLGGVAVALSVSVVNVVLLGAVLGLFPARWLHHRNLVLKALGLVLLAAGLSAIVLVNAFVAHYRDAFERVGEAVVLRDVWAHLTAAPADLARLQSWLLFLLGLGFAGLGFAKGFHLDDPYPGYGAVDRRRAEAEGTYLTNRQFRIEDATETRDRVVAAIASGIERLRGAAAQRMQILAARAGLVQKVAAHEQHLAHAANVLLTRYRDANRAHRTKPPPPHFSKPFSFPDEILERAPIRLLREAPAPRHDADTLVKELDDLRTRVLAVYSAFLAAAPPEV
jgi:hypothetical protein